MIILIIMINSNNILYNNDKHIDDNLPAGLFLDHSKAGSLRRCPAHFRETLSVLLSQRKSIVRIMIMSSNTYK